MPTSVKFSATNGHKVTEGFLLPNTDTLLLRWQSGHQCSSLKSQFIKTRRFKEREICLKTSSHVRRCNAEKSGFHHESRATPTLALNIAFLKHHAATM